MWLLFFSWYFLELELSAVCCPDSSWNGSGCPYYHWYHFCFQNPHSLFFFFFSDTGLFFLVPLLNQRWSPPLRLQASHCSTFRIMCHVPIILWLLLLLLQQFESHLITLHLQHFLYELYDTPRHSVTAKHDIPNKKSNLRVLLTFWRRNFLFYFSTPCI